MSTAKRISFFVVAMIVSFTVIVTTFADSPQIEDASITFSIKGYYVQYAQTVTYTSNVEIWQDGTLQNVVSTANYKTTSAFDVVGGGTVFVYRADSANHLQQIISCCFYDSEGNVVEGGFNSPNVVVNFVDVPQLATSCRLTIARSGGPSAAATNSKPIAAPQSGVNASNYQYLWGEVSEATLDSDGFVVLPYQTYGYTWFWIDYTFFDSTFEFSNIAFTTYALYTGGYFTGERLLSYLNLDLQTFFTDTSGNTTFDEVGYTTSGNPYRFVAQIPYDRFSGFRIMYNLDSGLVSTSVKVKVYDFQLDGEDVSAELDARKAIEGLENIGNQMILPTPDVSSVYTNLTNVVVQMNDDNFLNFDWLGPTGSIVTTMCVTTFTFAALGYILFGKKG